MNLLDQLQGFTQTPYTTKKSKPKPRVGKEGATAREQEHLDALISLGGEASTNDISKLIQDCYYSSVMYLRKLEKKGFVTVSGEIDRKGANKMIIWSIVKK